MAYISCHTITIKCSRGPWQIGEFLTQSPPTDWPGWGPNGATSHGISIKRTRLEDLQVLSLIKIKPV